MLRLPQWGRCLAYSLRQNSLGFAANSSSRRSGRLMASAGAGEASSKQKVKLALCQLGVSSDKQANLRLAGEAVKDAADNGASLVVLPEMFNCPYSNESFPEYAEDIDGGNSDSARQLSGFAASNSVTLVAGSMPERSQGKLYNTCLVIDSQGKQLAKHRKGKLYNTCLVIDSQGKQLAKHRKVHLFDIDIPGKQTFRESDTLTPGQSLTVVDTAAGRLGIGICFDIRFQEMAMIYARKGVQLIVYPGAFNTTTGPPHWELLQRAQAVNNQLFVATCSPARDLDFSYQAWGHSSAFSPWGECLGTTGHEPAIVYADLDYSEVQTRRQNMPLASQKRSDLYELIDHT